MSAKTLTVANLTRELKHDLNAPALVQDIDQVVAARDIEGVNVILRARGYENLRWVHVLSALIVVHACRSDAALALLLDRVEGKVPQRVEGYLDVSVNIRLPAGLEKRPLLTRTGEATIIDAPVEALHEKVALLVENNGEAAARVWETPPTIPQLPNWKKSARRG
jgi:hypothetical protein